MTDHDLTAAVLRLKNGVQPEIKELQEHLKSRPEDGIPIQNGVSSLEQVDAYLQDSNHVHSVVNTLREVKPLIQAYVTAHIAADDNYNTNYNADIKARWALENGIDDKLKSKVADAMTRSIMITEIITNIQDIAQKKAHPERESHFELKKPEALGMAEPVSAQFVKDVALDLDKNSNRINVNDGGKSWSGQPILGVNVPITLDALAAAEKPDTLSQRLSVADKAKAVHLALAERAGLTDTVTAGELAPNKLFSTPVFEYETAKTYSPAETKDRLARAAREVENMSPPELGQFTARVNAIYTTETSRERFLTAHVPEHQLQAPSQVGAKPRVEDPVVRK